MMNYHEMTMNEPRNSPARRQQYLVICTIMAGVFVHAVITSGGISSIDIRERVFPGGDFVYRLNQRYGTVRCDEGMKMKLKLKLKSTRENQNEHPQDRSRIHVLLLRVVVCCNRSDMYNSASLSCILSNLPILSLSLSHTHMSQK